MVRPKWRHAALSVSEPEFTGRRKKMIPRQFRGVKGVGRLQDSRVVVGIISRQIKPAVESRFARQVDPSCQRAIGIEEIPKTRRRPRNGEIAAVHGRVGRVSKTEGETDDIVKAAVEILSGQAHAIIQQFLLQASRPVLAGLRFQQWISEVAKVVAQSLVEARLFNPLSVKGARNGIAENTGAVTQHHRAAGPRNHPGSKIGVGFGACAEVQCQPSKWTVAKIQIPALVVSAGMIYVHRRERRVLHFIFIASCGRKVRQQVRSLRTHIGAVVLKAALPGEIAEFRGRHRR